MRWTELHLERFLRDIIERTGVDSIDLIAHSMGNRCLTEAIRRLVSDPDIARHFGEVVLTAPDIVADIFSEDIAPKIVGKGWRVTLYASSS